MCLKSMPSSRFQIFKFSSLLHCSIPSCNSRACIYPLYFLKCLWHFGNCSGWNRTEVDRSSPSRAPQQGRQTELSVETGTGSFNLGKECCQTQQVSKPENLSPRTADLLDARGPELGRKEFIETRHINAVCHVSIFLGTKSVKALALQARAAVRRDVIYGRQRSAHKTTE